VAEKILLADSVRPESPEDIVMTITLQNSLGIIKISSSWKTCAGEIKRVGLRVARNLTPCCRRLVRVRSQEFR
jgi:hypothetical protein